MGRFRQGWRLWLAALVVVLTAAGAGWSLVAAPPAGGGAVCGPGWAERAGELASWSGPLEFFTGGGSYRPRTHCLVNEAGNPDWPWIAAFIAVNLVVIVGYLKIFLFWKRCYHAEAPENRNNKLMDLAHIFLWCAVCGYVLAVMTFVWPAYRLAVACLAVLGFFTWKFIMSIDDFRVSISAVRYKRELEKSLVEQNRELELLVAERTRDAERAREEAEEASRAKSAFVANMSHEIRTPMTAILGYTDMALEHADDAASVEEAGRVIRRNAQHLLGVINDVLDISKIEAGKMEIERMETPTARVVTDALAFLRPVAEEKKVKLSGALETEAPESVLIDPTKTRQIVINLISNAVKFTPSGSVAVRVSYDADSSELRIEVEDTGIGMTEAQQDGLFEAFAQAESSTNRRFGGSGLGLAISREFARRQEGDLTVRSAPGEGSVFTCTLRAPATPGAGTVGPGALEAECERELEQRRRGPELAGRVLLVEDGVDNRMLIERILSRAGAEVTLASHGGEALEAVRAGEPFDLILMDMQMPVMDGYTATRELRASGCAAPIVALTAHAMREELEACLKAGCDDAASKPIERGEFLELCRSWIARRSMDRAAGRRAAG